MGRDVTQTCHASSFIYTQLKEAHHEEGYEEANDEEALYDEEGFYKESIKQVPTMGMLHRPGLQAAAAPLQNLEGIFSLLILYYILSTAAKVFTFVA